MTAYLLDTNHASPLVTPGHLLILRMQRQQTLGDTFAICVPMLAEVLFGIGIAPRAVKNLELWIPWEQSMGCHIPDASDARQAAELQIRLRRQGHQLTTIDALIAITALRYNLTLLTTMVISKRCRVYDSKTGYSIELGLTFSSPRCL